MLLYSDRGASTGNWGHQKVTTAVTATNLLFDPPLVECPCLLSCSHSSHHQIFLCITSPCVALMTVMQTSALYYQCHVLHITLRCYTHCNLIPNTLFCMVDLQLRRFFFSPSFPFFGRPCFAPIWSRHCPLVKAEVCSCGQSEGFQETKCSPLVHLEKQHKAPEPHSLSWRLH